MSEIELTKFKTLSEDVTYKNQKQFAQALSIVKSTHFKNVRKPTARPEFENLAEETNKRTTAMDGYLAALNRTRKK